MPYRYWLDLLASVLSKPHICWTWPNVAGSGTKTNQMPPGLNLIWFKLQAWLNDSLVGTLNETSHYVALYNAKRCRYSWSARNWSYHFWEPANQGCSDEIWFVPQCYAIVSQVPARKSIRKYWHLNAYRAKPYSTTCKVIIKSTISPTSMDALPALHLIHACTKLPWNDLSRNRVLLLHANE